MRKVKRKSWFLWISMAVLLFVFMSGGCGGGGGGGDNLNPEPPEQPEPPIENELTREELDEVRDSGDVEVFEDLENATVQFIGGNDLSSVFPDSVTNVEQAIVALDRIRTLLGITNDSAGEVFSAAMSAVNSDENGSYFNLQQVYNGVPVYAESIVMAADSDGNVQSLSSTYKPIGNISTTPTISEDQAKTIAGNQVKAEIDEFVNLTDFTQANADELKNEMTLSSMLVIHVLNDSPQLVWKVNVDATVINNDYFIDQTGKIVETIKNIYQVAVQAKGTDALGNSRTFTVDKVSDNVFEMHDPVRKIKTYMPVISKPTSLMIISNDINAWPNTAAVSAHYNVAQVYDYYKNKLGRNSIDGSGMEIISAVNYRFFQSANGGWTERGAAWWGNKKLMLFGTRDRSIAAALDVVGHEFTHGVAEHLVGSGGFYRSGESGSLSEAYSDILGKLIARSYGDNTWLMGGAAETGGSRNIQNPWTKSHPKEYNGINYQTGTGEAAFYPNSCVVSHAAYLMVNKGLSIDEVAKLWYGSLSRMNAKATFLHCRYNVVATAKAQRLSDDKIRRINEAFDEVKIGVPDVIIRLTWGSTPADLDSHLTGPSVNGNGRFHIYFSDGSYNDNQELVAFLDRDDTDGSGPEYTTIRKLTPGDYRFFIHDYTNREESSSTEMGGSRANVHLQYYAATNADGNRNERSQDFPVPVSGGTLWHVFTLTVDETGLVSNVTTGGAMSYVSSPEAIAARSVGNPRAVEEEDLKLIQRVFLEAK